MGVFSRLKLWWYKVTHGLRAPRSVTRFMCPNCDSLNATIWHDTVISFRHNLKVTCPDCFFHSSDSKVIERLLEEGSTSCYPPQRSE